MYENNFRTQPRFIMQAYKNDQVPKLVSIQIPKNKANQHQIEYHEERKESKKRQELQKQLQYLENQLKRQQSSINEYKEYTKILNIKKQKLQQININLVERIEQLQQSYSIYRQSIQIKYQQNIRKYKKVYFNKIEQYIKNIVQKFTSDIKQIKMTNFIEELLKINPLIINLHHQQTNQNGTLRDIILKHHNIQQNIHSINHKDFTLALKSNNYSINKHYLPQNTYIRNSNYYTNQSKTKDQNRQYNQQYLYRKYRDDDYISKQKEGKNHMIEKHSKFIDSTQRKHPINGNKSHTYSMVSASPEERQSAFDGTRLSRFTKSNHYSKTPKRRRKIFDY